MTTTKILQLTDLHVRPEGMAAYRVCESTMLTDRALRAAARLQPDVVIITGDLTDCGLADEYKLLNGMLQRHLAMPVYVVPATTTGARSCSSTCRARGSMTALCSMRWTPGQSGW